MKKSVLVLSFLLVLFSLCALIHSCVKKDTQLRLSYSVDSIFQNVYVGDTGYTHWPLKISFLNGNPQEQVTITINGLPGRLLVTPNPVTATPTFTQDFIFRGNYVNRGTYLANLVAYSPTTGNRTYNFNIVVVAANCGLSMTGTYSGSNVCTYGSTPYTATVSQVSGVSSGDTLNINNLGGYGTSSNTKVIMNCNVDSVTIPNQPDGNGDTLKGVGTFTANKMIIYYTKKTARGGSDSCVATLNKQ